MGPSEDIAGFLYYARSAAITFKSLKVRGGEPEEHIAMGLLAQPSVKQVVKPAFAPFTYWKLHNKPLQIMSS